jgi:hypothetical protein
MPLQCCPITSARLNLSCSIPLSPISVPPRRKTVKETFLLWFHGDICNVHNPGYGRVADTEQNFVIAQRHPCFWNISRDGSLDANSIPLRRIVDYDIRRSLTPASSRRRPHDGVLLRLVEG